MWRVFNKLFGWDYTLLTCKRAGSSDPYTQRVIRVFTLGGNRYVETGRGGLQDIAEAVHTPLTWTEEDA